MLKRFGKKGNFTDIFDYFTLAVFIGFLGVIFVVFLNQSHDHLISNPVINQSTEAVSILDNANNKWPVAYDLILPIVFVLFYGFSLFAARKVQSTHKFLIVGVILCFAVFLFSLFFENFWYGITNSTLSVITLAVGQLKYTTFMLNYLRFFALFYSITVGLALYAKTE